MDRFSYDGPILELKLSVVSIWKRCSPVAGPNSDLRIWGTGSLAPEFWGALGAAGQIYRGADNPYIDRLFPGAASPKR